MILWKTLIERQLHDQNDEDSHVELDCGTFHPSSLSRCERQCTIQKLGLEEHGINTLWNFYLGTRQHEDLREWFEGVYPGVEFEKELSHSVEHRIQDKPLETAIHFTGHCDVYDPFEEAIYDFKTRKSWNGFDGASDARRDQLTTYMKMADVDRGQLVYVIKSAPWDETKDIVKTWPEEGFYDFDESRWAGILDRARRIHDALHDFQEQHGSLPRTVSEVPSDPCGCWLCDSEREDLDES